MGNLNDDGDAGGMRGRDEAVRGGEAMPSDAREEIDDGLRCFALVVLKIRDRDHISKCGSKSEGSERRKTREKLTLAQVLASLVHYSTRTPLQSPRTYHIGLCPRFPRRI